ncbi:hypothetical protein PFISCL1PPCAC_2720 [Pristionchus fissidentatus]|uniref:mRNA-capping enzyme n=1 Tax=Pristionchus fissidentatus TaxID=1538716 RepID=A0AAV5UYY1_9BILA|nr:hypothetical protein PFISCL1PPCAC_2720 [Pristionchus fissidentatus]
MSDDDGSKPKRGAYDDTKGPNPTKAAQLGLPDRWLHCPKIGKVVENMFLPFKTPLCSLYDNQMKKEQQFHPQQVFDSPQAKGKKIGLWVDLTKTDRFYYQNEVEKNGCKYRKIKMAGHGSSPTMEEVQQFNRLCSGFLHDNPGQLIGVHCTHGFNRTGFVIISYLVEIMDWGVEAAVRTFAAARATGIYKQDYINDLYERYDDIDDVLEAPQKPKWNYNEEVYELEETGEEASTSKNDADGESKPAASNKRKSNKIFADGKMPEVVPLEDEGLKRQLRHKIKDLIKYKRDGFPGSQPVSMEMSPERNNLFFLAQRRYRMSWKADGSRYLIYICDKDQVYAFDRDNEVFPLPRLTFPHRKVHRHITNTLVDCELIFDEVGGREVPRILIYDIITFEGINLGKENFDIRLDCIRKEIYGAREKGCAEGRVHKERELCSVRVKDFWPIETTEKVLSDEFTRNVAHEIDGLIFQPVDEPYVPGRCDTVLKWKPPSHNSVDFKLQIRKVAKEGELPQHVGFLYVQHSNEHVDTMKATRSLLPYDNKIIECRRESNQWVFMRERTDKSLPNSLKTALAVVASMKYPIEKETLISFIKAKGYKGGPQRMKLPEQNGGGGQGRNGAPQKRREGGDRSHNGQEKRQKAEEDNIQYDETL